jgi:N-acetylglutamate synthase/N-acetylornithine aminotransferase
MTSSALVDRGAVVPKPNWGPVTAAIGRPEDQTSAQERETIEIVTEAHVRHG